MCTPPAPPIPWWAGTADEVQLSDLVSVLLEGEEPQVSYSRRANRLGRSYRKSLTQPLKNQYVLLSSSSAAKQ